MLIFQVNSKKTYKDIAALHKQTFVSIEPFKIDLRSLDRDALVQAKKEYLDLVDTNKLNIASLQDQVRTFSEAMRRIVKDDFMVSTKDNHFSATQKLTQLTQIAFMGDWIDQMRIARKNFILYETITEKYNINYSKIEQNATYDDPDKKLALTEFAQVAAKVIIERHLVEGKQPLSTREKIAYGIEPETWLEDIEGKADRMINQVLRQQKKPLIG